MSSALLRAVAAAVADHGPLRARSSLVGAGDARGWRFVVLRLTYLGLTNAFALLRLLPRSDRAKDIEILTLRHQIAVLYRQLDGQRICFLPTDRALLAALRTPCHGQPCAACGYSCAQRPFCAGTAT
jgi:hypothetical protein